VGASVFGAISLAYGRECLKQEAEACWLLAWLFSELGPDPDVYAAWVWTWKTFVDGKYITARAYFDTFGRDFFDTAEAPPAEAPAGE
jgi:hypothetical protein